VPSASAALLDAIAAEVPSASAALLDAIAAEVPSSRGRLLLDDIAAEKPRGCPPSL
jgi:hypothetical protein